MILVKNIKVNNDEPMLLDIPIPFSYVGSCNGYLRMTAFDQYDITFDFEVIEDYDHINNQCEDVYCTRPYELDYNMLQDANSYPTIRMKTYVANQSTILLDITDSEIISQSEYGEPGNSVSEHLHMIIFERLLQDLPMKFYMMHNL